jgi:hypothetical protein
MIKTSQNRVAVNQAQFANQRGEVLSAAVVHQCHTSMRPYSTRRTDLTFGLSSARPGSKRKVSEVRLSKPDGRDPGQFVPGRLWARLVLSKMNRG